MRVVPERSKLHRGDDRAVVRDEEIAVHRREHADEQQRPDAERKAERHERACGRGLAVEQHRGKNRPIAKVHGAAVAMSLRPPMIASRFALMKVSPSQARPRMPMIAVMPDWHVLLLGTSRDGRLGDRQNHRGDARA